MARTLTLTAPAKVNLYLGVGPLRADGFHEVSTVLQALELADTLVIQESDALSLTCEPSLGVPDEANLAWKAAELFAREFDTTDRVAIALHKRIPHGAGLGGGSSDAAAVLAGLAHWNGIERDSAALLAIARQLGADVSFFLLGGLALFAGRGDELVRALPCLDADVVLFKTPLPVSTAEAYATFDSDPQIPAGPEAVIAGLLSADIAVLGHSLANNMEKAAGILVPETAEALRWARAWPGALGAALAGSGSAGFALVSDATIALEMAEEAQSRGWWATATRFSRNGVSVHEGADAA